MSPVHLYKCSICSTVFTTERKAKVCESKGRPKASLKIGAEFDLPYVDKGTKIATIKKVVVGRSWHGQHYVRYHVDWNGRNTWLSEASLAERIKEG